MDNKYCEETPQLIPLGKLCQKLRGVSYSKDEASFVPSTNSVPILRANNIDDDELNYEDLVYVPKVRVSEKQFLQKGDVVIAMSSGSKKIVGKGAQLKNDWKGSFGAFCGVLRPNPDKVNPNFFGYYFSSAVYRSYISDVSAGTNINNLKNEHFENIIFPLPSPEIQQTLVSQLDVLLPKIKLNKARLGKAKNVVAKLRQSIFYSAITGKLTEDWRAKNRFINNLPEKYNKIDFKETEMEGWVQTNVRNIYTSFGGGTPSRGNSDYWGGEISWVSSGDVKQDYIEEGSETITKAGLESSSAKICPVGSVIVVVRSGILKHTLPVSMVQNKLAINQDIKCFDGNDDRLNKWLFYYLKGKANDILALNREGTTVQSVKYETLRDLDIEFPPAEEQKVIEERVVEYIKIADQVEKQIEMAEARVGKLTQSILAKTFKGNSD